MKIFASAVALLALVTVGSARAEAQHIKLELQNGLVTLDAQNVTVRQILAEWARVGGTTIINGEKVIGGPVTLQLKAVPERRALDTILRGVSGYMLAARQASNTGVSGFDRILIMPTSSAPRAAMPAAVPPAQFQTRPQRVEPVPEPVETEAVQDDAVPDDDHDAEPDAGPGGPESEEAEEELEPEAGPNQQFQRPPAFPNPMSGQVQPFNPQGPFLGGPRQVPTEDDEAAAPPTTAPLNVPPGASAVPGVIAPVPQQQDGEQPNPRRRRPPL